MEVTLNALKFRMNFNLLFPCTQIDFVLCYNILVFPSKKPRKEKAHPRAIARIKNQVAIWNSAAEFGAVALGLTGISLICNSSIFFPGNSAKFLLLCRSLWLCEQAQISWLSNNSLHWSLVSSGFTVGTKTVTSTWMLLIFLWLSQTWDVCWKDGCVPPESSGAAGPAAMLRNIWEDLKRKNNGSVNYKHWSWT